MPGRVLYKELLTRKWKEKKRILRYHEGSSFGKQLLPGLGLELGTHRSLGLRSLRRGVAQLVLESQTELVLPVLGKLPTGLRSHYKNNSECWMEAAREPLDSTPEGASAFSSSPTSSLPPVPPMGRTQQQQLAKAPYPELCTQGKLVLRATPQLQTHHGKSLTRHYLNSLKLNALGCGMGKYYPSQDQ